MVLLVQDSLFRGSTNFLTLRCYCDLTILVCFRAKLDDNARLLDFTQKLEAACIGAVESGKMTKDLALLVHGSSK
jgi:isocitrate dehydrogenase